MSTFEPLFRGHRETCYNCFERECKCGKVSPDDCLGFIDRNSGKFINDPFLSSDGNYFVDPVTYYEDSFTNWVGTENYYDWRRKERSNRR